MPRCGGCAPPGGPEGGTVIEDGCQGIFASSPHEKKHFFYKDTLDKVHEGLHAFANPTYNAFIMFIPLKAGRRNGD
jgi:hypothetical protein